MHLPGALAPFECSVTACPVATLLDSAVDSTDRATEARDPERRGRLFQGLLVS